MSILESQYAAAEICPAYRWRDLLRLQPQSMDDYGDDYGGRWDRDSLLYTAAFEPIDEIPVV